MAFAFVLALASVALVVALRELRIDGVDTNLRIRADDLQSLVESEPQLEAAALASVRDTVAQIVGPGGEVIAATHASISSVRLAPNPENEHTFTSTDIIVDDDVFRVYSRALSDGGVIHVAQSIDDVNEAQAILIGVLVVSVPVVTAILAAGVWILVGRTLDPVEQMRAEVASIGADRLDRRVPVPVGDDEISRLARTMNEMLARVEDAHRRQLDFTADASHELRSPLTRIRSELEVDLAHPDGADPTATHESVLEEVGILQRTIDGLLLLARGESSSVGVPVDLDDIVLREVGALRAQAAIGFDVRGVGAAQVIGDELALTRLIRNLLDNAARHADQTVRVEVRTGEAESVAFVVVADDGPGVALEDSERIFERFVRLDEARQRGGAGLGLAIARSVAEGHGGTVVLRPGSPPGATFEVRLPVR